MSVACSFSGKYGDALWSLPTIREISRKFGEPVDFYTMPEFAGTLPIIEQQPYINNVFTLDDWHPVDLSPGAQPYQHPKLPKEYDHEFALGYSGWPNMALMDFTLWSANRNYDLRISFQDPIPFLNSRNYIDTDIAFGYSIYYDSQKENFKELLVAKLKEQKPDLTYYDVSLPMSWLAAYNNIDLAKVFVGDKSALHVLAHGLGKPVVETESNRDRRADTFCCPHNKFYTADVDNILDGLDEYTDHILNIIL